MLKSGLLRNKVDFYSVEQQVNDIGDPITVDTLLASRRANIRPMSARELSYAGGIEAEVTHVITARYLEDIKHTDKIVWGNRQFEIVSIINEDERNKTLIFTTKEKP